MFVKCTGCGYLTPENATLCKNCGRIATASVDPDPVETPEPEPFAVPAAAVPPIRPEVVPAPTHAPPGSAAPPPPPAGPVASMFPEPHARPPRRSLPTWSVVSAAIVVVVVALGVGVVASSGGSDATKARDRATRTLERVEQDTGIELNALLTRADLGRAWTELGTEAIPERSLTNDGGACYQAIGFAPDASTGRSRQFSHDLDATGAETGHLTASVRAYRSVADAQENMEARAADDYAPCVDESNVDYLTGPSTENVVGDAPTRSIVTDAIVWRQTLHYVYRGVPQTMDFWIANLAHGRFRTTLLISGSLTNADVDELVNVAIRRLAAHAPEA